VGLILLLGGARSGKSALAQRIGLAWGGDVVVIATGEPRDEDFARRIARHRAERPPAWRTVEEPLALAAAIGDVDDGAFLVIECLTLWVANLLAAGRDEEAVLASAAGAARLAAGRAGPTVAVSNEVGLGVHPATPSGREFRDVLGRVNRSWAEAAEQSLLVVAGRALPLLAPEAVLRSTAAGSGGRRPSGHEREAG
jgi:adenosyl cobinamide kinase/adenosyl cobinamide phosphate guanylyltransferase